MASLRKAGQDYILDCASARLCLVGKPEALHPVKVPDSPIVTLLTPTRAEFVLGLIEILSHGKAALMAPSHQLLSRLPSAPPALALQQQPTSGDRKRDQARVFTPDDAVCTVLTSGSTGDPQLFDKSARQLFEEALTWARLLDLSPQSTVLSTTAPHHVYGLLFGILAPWAGGSKVVAQLENEPSSFHPAHVERLAREHQVTHLITVPAHLKALLQAPIELPSIEKVVSSAAPLLARDASAFERKFEVEVLDVLGSTETGGIAMRRPSVSPTYKPLPGVTIGLDDDKCLVVKSPFLATPGEPARSDERARVHTDGTFEYLGRSDSIVKVGGKRVSLREIDQLVQSLPGVSDAVTLSRSVEALRGEEILLVVAGNGLNREAIRSSLRANLEAVFVPRKIRIVDALPRDERGKLKRSDLLALFAPTETAQNTLAEVVLLSEDSPRFSGHFEGDPLLPALAQLADIVLPAIRKAHGGGALAELTRVKWTHALRPGATVSVRLEEKPRGIYFELWDGETLACSGKARLEPEPGKGS